MHTWGHVSTPVDLLKIKLQTVVVQRTWMLWTELQSSEWVEWPLTTEWWLLFLQTSYRSECPLGITILCQPGKKLSATCPMGFVKCWKQRHGLWSWPFWFLHGIFMWAWAVSDIYPYKPVSHSAGKMRSQYSESSKMRDGVLTLCCLSCVVLY